ADVNMSWLALRGRLEREFERAGIAEQAASSFDGAEPSKATGRLDQALALLATLGLAWSVADLGDLFEPQAGTAYAFVQLGGPVAAFGAAALSSFGALALSRRRQLGIRQAEAAASLRKAAIAILAIGAIAFAAAELGEHGLQ